MALNDFLQGVANAIRVKKGTTAPIPANNFADEILSIRTGGGGSSSVGLFSPNIAINEDTLTIGNENGNFANGFEIYIDGVLADTVTDRTVLLTDLVETHEKDEVVKVKAISDILSNSYFSNEATWYYITEELEYALSDDGTYYLVVGIGNVTERAVIKSNIGGIPVTTIENNAFLAQNITSVLIPNTITKIGSNSFQECTNLTNIEIPDSVETIGNRAFNKCSNLESIVIGSGVSKIYNNAFYLCNKIKRVDIKDLVSWLNISFTDIYSTPVNRGRPYLNNEVVTEIIFPNGTPYIRDFVCCGFYDLTKVEIPDGVTSIGEGAFYSCSSLTSVVIPDSVTTIGEKAFQYCSSLTSVVIPDSVTTLRRSAFEECRSLASIELPNGITYIDDYMLSRCRSLTNIVIPDSVTSIRDGAFFECYSLASITIHNSVTLIGISAFAYCNALKNINYLGTISEWGSITKQTGWNTNTGEYTIHCTDGDIPKSA